MAAKRKQFDFGAAMASSFENISPAVNSSTTVAIMNEASNSADNGEHVVLLRAEQIEANPANEKIYEISDLEALAKDISERGIQQPLLVRQKPDGKFQIVSGHRRFAANKLAVESFGYKTGELIPCLIKQDIKDQILEREAVVLDNLQRDKTDFNRMMELVSLRECAEERRKRGENIPNVRQYLSDKVGVSQSELHRYLSIADLLIGEFILLFRNQMMTTNVAYELSRLDPPTQRKIYNAWQGGASKNEVLTLPMMQTYRTGEQAAAKRVSTQRTSEKPMFKYKTIEQGTSDVRRAFEAVTDGLKASGLGLDRTATKRVLKKLGKARGDLEEVLELLSGVSE